MDNIKIQIVDDNPANAEQLKLQLEPEGYKITSVNNSVKQMLNNFNKETPDLVLFNLYPAGKTKILDIAKSVSNYIRFTVPVIFITQLSNLQFIDKIKKIFPNAYLVNTSKQSSVTYATEQALLNFQYNNLLFAPYGFKHNQDYSDILFVKKMHNIIKVPIETIMYIEVASNYSTISSTLGNFTIKLSLNNLLNRLPKSEFIRVHKNYAVNLKEVNEFNFQEFTVRLNKKYLPIGKKYKPHIKENLNILY